MLRQGVRVTHNIRRSPYMQAVLISLMLAAAISYSYFQIATDANERLFVLGAGLAASVAIWGVWNQWAITRRNLTIQFLRELETDKDYIEALNLFNKAAANGRDIRCYAHGYDESSKKFLESATDHKQSYLRTERAIILVLNTDEMIATGIRNSILDYRLVCAYRRQTMMRRYAVSKGFIDELRTASTLPTAYVEMERLASRLTNDPYHSLL